MDDEVADLENIGEQFRFLLQPVRDLAKNWDIDIKHYLEEYLNKLAQEHDNDLDARGKRKIFNFAEAAVVIDGSTNIYCRKVDYLLQQTQDCLTEISASNEKRKKKKAITSEGDENAAPDEEGDGDGADDEEIEDPDETRRRKNPYLKPIDAEVEEQMRVQLHKLAKKRPCFPIVPLAFTPLMEFEKSDVLLYHRGGEKKSLEMVGKKDDFRVNTCQVVDGVALIDLKNAELLDMFSRTLHTPTVTRTSASSAAPTVNDDDAPSERAGSLTSRVSTNAFGDHFDVDNSENVDPNGDGDFFDFSNEDLVVEYKDLADDMSTQPKGDLLNSQLAAMLGDGVPVNEDQRMSVFFAADSERPLVDGYSQNSLHEAAVAAAAADTVGLRTQSSIGFTGVASSLEYDADSAPCDLRQSQANGGLIVVSDDMTLVEKSTARKTRKQLAADLEEPFEPLDPMELRNAKSRPFQLDKSCVTDAAKQIRQRDRRIEKECRERNIPNVSTVKNFIDTRIFGQKIRKKSHVFATFNSFLMDRALLALNAEFYAEQERRAAIQKRRNEAARLERRLACRTSQRTSVGAAAHKDSVARLSNFRGGGVHSPQPAYEDPIDELGADEVIDYACEPPDMADLHGDDRPLGDILNVEDLGEQSFMADGDNDDDWDRNYGGRRRSALIRNDNNIFDDTIYAGPSVDYPDELPPRPLSQMEYNDLVEYHLKKYWTIKEEATTKFAERVRDWENKVNPLLDKELDHDAFNTRTYSTRLLDSFANGVGSEIDFMEFAKAAIGPTGDQYNLSRYLLVSLILTNMQNVEIVSADVNRLKLRLTKLERHDEVFDDEQRLITGGE